MSGSASLLELKGLRTSSLKNINLAISSGEIVAVVGSRTHERVELINAIAGLTRYDGTILIEGKPIKGLKAGDGIIGYFLHEPAPDVTVLASVTSSLKPLGFSKDEATVRAMETLRSIDIEELSGKTIKELSSLEFELFKLTYIIALSPKVVLLNEPFERLTLEERHILGHVLRTLKQKYAIILTSKLMSNVDMIADRVLLLNEGEAIQFGRPNELIFEPTNQFVSNIICGGNLFVALSAVIITSGLALVNCSGNLIFLVPYEKGRIERVAIYPEGIKVFKQRPENITFNLIKTLVHDVNEIGGEVYLQLGIVGGGKLMARLNKTAAKILNIGKEDHVYAWIDPAYIRTLVRI